MNKGRLIIDTNLFLLLVIGSVEEGRHIVNSKRLNAYSIEDLDVILEVMKSHSEVCVTNYIAAEVSNLIDLSGHARDAAFEFARYYFSTFTQIESNLRVDSGLDNFLIYGVTDCSLVSLSAEYVILTNDGRLMGALYAVCPENIIPFKIAKQLYNS